MGILHGAWYQQKKKEEEDGIIWPMAIFSTRFIGCEEAALKTQIPLTPSEIINFWFAMIVWPLSAMRHLNSKASYGILSSVNPKNVYEYMNLLRKWSFFLFLSNFWQV